MKSWKLSVLLVFLLLTVATPANTTAWSSLVQLNPICGTWLSVNVYSGAFTFPGIAILPDTAANPHLIYKQTNLVVGNYYCIYNPVIESISPPASTSEGYSISQKITDWSTIEPAGGQPPSAEFDAWPQNGIAPLSVSMHIVSTDNISSCLWEYGDGNTGTSCDAYHDHVYTSAGSYTVKLTVTGSGGSNTMTRSNYITVTATTVCYTLTKSVNPSNSGSVIAFPIPNCSDGKYAAGTQLSLVATPLSGYKFTSWSGSLSGNANPATLLMDADKSVIANFSQSSFCSAVTEIPQTECEALISLYNNTNGAGWSDNSNWLDTTSPCSWFGITCGNNHVVRLELLHNQLNGALPQQLSALTNLQTLDLSLNQLSGPIPSALGSLTNLTALSLFDNQLSGAIPTSFGSLSNLQLLLAYGNQLSGNMPTQLGYLINLLELDLASNQLSGSIPVQIGDLGKLERLNLNSNQLSGSIPSEIGKLTKLVGIDLSSNQLSGNLPNQLGDLTNLYSLFIENNPLSGALPSNLVNLNMLDSFGFNNTNLCEPEDNSFQNWLTRISYLNRTGVICTSTPTVTPTLTPVTPVPTPTATLQSVIFIPGIGGSVLKKQNDHTTLWPSTRWQTDRQKQLTLKSNFATPIFVEDIVDTFTIYQSGGVGIEEPVYKPLLDVLQQKYVPYIDGLTCDSQPYATLFVFPYDFRFGVTEENVIHLKELVDCIQTIHPNSQINIVAHSMGGLLARKYIISYSEHHINKLITIGTPWLGAPQSINVLLNGDWLPQVIAPQTMKLLGEHWPGAHQLLPSKQYFENVSLKPMIVGDRPIAYNEFNASLQERYPSSVDFIHNNEMLFGDPKISDWQGDQTHVEYHVLYGDMNVDNTIVQFHEWKERVCGEYGCGYLTLWDVVKGRGDATVPLASSSRIGNVGLNGSATLHGFSPHGILWWKEDLSHLGLTSNTRVQTCILSILKATDKECEDDMATAAMSKEATSVHYIRFWGVKALEVTNGTSTTGNVMDATQAIIPLEGMQIEFLGADGILLTLPHELVYTITAIVGENPIIEATYGTGEKNSELIRYVDLPVVPETMVKLETSATNLATLTVDADSDGEAESEISPTSNLRGAQAQDTVPPTVQIQIAPDTNIVSVIAHDDESQVGRIFLSLDGTTFYLYNQPDVVPKGITMVYAQAQDKAGNLSGVASLTLKQGEINKVFLPLVTN